MKKVLKTFLLMLMLVPCMFMFLGCGGGDDSTSSNGGRGLSLSVNPSVTFTIDKDDKVTSVILSNEDAGKIYANINFVGMNVDEAVEIFVELSAITGKLSFDNSNEFTISVTGENSEGIADLKTKVQTKINSACTELGITATFDVENTTQALSSLLDELVKYAPEYSKAELQEMYNSNAKEVIELAKTIQSKYSGLAYSQISSVLDNYTNNTTIAGYLSAVEVAKQAFKLAEQYLSSIEGLSSSLSQSEINEARASLNESKRQFEAAIATLNNQIDTIISGLESSFQSAKASLVEASKTLKDTFKSTTYNTLTATQKAKIDELINTYFPAV